MFDRALTYPYMDSPVKSIDSTFRQELLQYKIPHSTMLQNIPKYDRRTDPKEHIDTYEWKMTSLRVDNRFTCTDIPVMQLGNVANGSRKCVREVSPALNS